MRVITCLAYDHEWWIVLLAVLMCGAGSAISATLLQRTVARTGTARWHWCFLSAVTAGAATWATHFIAMLGYSSKVPVAFDGPLTIASALIAIAGFGAGIFLATTLRRPQAVVLGGATIGLSIAAMHYLGMFAYRVDGMVHWRMGYVAASLLVVSALAMLLVDRLRRYGMHKRLSLSIILVLAIASLHFTGMAAFTVTPIPGVSVMIQGESFVAVSLAIALVALLIIGMGLSTYLVESKAQAASEEQLAHLAMHDSLTMLANRHAFSAALKSECEKQKRYGRPFALFMIDLDRFKPINDTLGHPTGDLVLQKVAERLRRAVREGDLVARIGGMNSRSSPTAFHIRHRR